MILHKVRQFNDSLEDEMVHSPSSLLVCFVLSLTQQHVRLSSFNEGDPDISSLEFELLINRCVCNNSNGIALFVVVAKRHIIIIILTLESSCCPDESTGFFRKSLWIILRSIRSLLATLWVACSASGLSTRQKAAKNVILAGPSCFPPLRCSR